jgi:undecaprenyl pyrophosphate phosphatase UppP
MEDGLVGQARACLVTRGEGDEMPLVHIVLVLIIVGVLLWLINSFIPMDAKIKTLLNLVVTVAVIVWLLQAFGILGPLSRYRVR